VDRVEMANSFIMKLVTIMKGCMNTENLKIVRLVKATMWKDVFILPWA
jgi:hypothetical protein